MVTERTKKAGAGLAKAAGTAASKGANQAGNTPPLARQTVNKRDESHLYIWGLVWLWLVAPFLLLCLIAPQWGGALGNGISWGLNRCVGMAGWVMPMIAFLAASWCFNYNNKSIRINIKVVIPLLLFFSVFFAARCSQGGVIGEFIDNIIVGIIGKFGAWTFASLGFLSVFVFTWNLTTEETIEGCKALSQFSGSSLSELGHYTVSVLSKLWGWIISAGKHCVVLLISAKDKLSESHQEDEDTKVKVSDNEDNEPTDLEQKAIFYEESGIMPNASEKVEPLTFRGFFEDDSAEKKSDQSFEESLQAPRFAEHDPISVGQASLGKAEHNELLKEIHRRNTSGEMASVRNREYEAARKAELITEAKDNYNAGAPVGASVRRGVAAYPGADSLRSAVNDRMQSNWRGSEKRSAVQLNENKAQEPTLRIDRTEIRSGINAKHESATAKDGLALSRRLAERPAQNANSGFVRSSAPFSTHIRSSEKRVNDEKDLPLRPVRSSSSGGYKAARNIGNSFSLGTDLERRPNLVDSDETVEVASLKRTVEPKSALESCGMDGSTADELDKKVEALKFSEHLDSDLNLATSSSVALVEQAETVAVKAPVAVAEANLDDVSSQKMSALSPEERRRALGIIRRPAGGTRAQVAQPKADNTAVKAPAAVAEANLDDVSSQKMSALSPEERRRALGIIRRPAGGTRAQVAQPKADNTAVKAPAAVAEANLDDVSSQKMSALSPEERRRALGIIRRPAGGVSRNKAAQPQVDNAAVGASAAVAEREQKHTIIENESVSAASLQKLNILSPEERPSALPVDPENLESFSTLSPSQINALPPEERRRALGIRGTNGSTLNRDRNSLSAIKALRGAEGNNVACDPKAALNALSSRRPGVTQNKTNTVREATQTVARPAEYKNQASFTRSSTPSLMRSTASRSTAASRTNSTKQPRAEAPEMTKEEKLAAWRASTLRARASFKRQSEGKARLRQERAIKEVSEDMPFANDLMNPQGPALRPPVAQSQNPSAAAVLASKRTTRQQLGIIPRARKNGSAPASRHVAASAVRQVDGSDADDVDFRKKNSEIKLNYKIGPSETHSAIGSPEMLNSLVADGPSRLGVRPQLNEFSEASLNGQVKARLSQFHSAVGELQGVTWSEGGDLDSLLNPSKHSAAALAAVNKVENEAEVINLKPIISDVVGQTPNFVSAQKEMDAQVESNLPAEISVAQPAQLVQVAAEAHPQLSAKDDLAKAEEEDELPFPKPRSSANYKTINSAPAVTVAQPVDKESDVVATEGMIEKAANVVSRAEVASYVASANLSSSPELEENEQIEEKNVDSTKRPDSSVVESLPVEHSAVGPAALVKAKSTAEVKVPDELFAAAAVNAELSADSVSSAAESKAVKRFDLGLGNEGAAIDFDSIMPRDRDRFTNLRPINLTGSSVYRNPIRPSFFAIAPKSIPAVAATTQPVPVMPAVAATAQPAPVIPAVAATTQPVPVIPAVAATAQPAPVMPAVAATAQPAPVMPAVAATTQPVPVMPAVAATTQPVPVIPAVAATTQPAPVMPAAAATAQPAPVTFDNVDTPKIVSTEQIRRSPAFGFERGERRIIGSATPVSDVAFNASRPAALHSSTSVSVGRARVVGQSVNAADSAPLAMPRKSNSGALQAIEHYMLPSLSLLDEVPPKNRHEFINKSELLVRTLASFKVEATVCNVIQGPAVTRYELKPATGVSVKRFTNLTNDIALALAATTVRIEAPVPGKSVVGVEVPNGFTELVALKEVLSSENFRTGKGLCVGLGKDISGAARITDLSRMPHLLVAGTTGSGKSVCINTLILSLLYRFTPRNLQLLMVDPKQVELSIYEGLPHLICLTGEEPGKIIVDPKMASSALHQMVNLMEERYTMLKKSKVRNIGEYNVKHPEAPLPWVVVIIDELADLMMVASKDVEKSICRLAQKARAAGIHMVVATQRPSTDVITGLLKVNIPSRIAFAVSSGVDSRVILDDNGAEHLLGKGDMLFKPVDAINGSRIQGAFVKNEEIQRVVDFWNRQDVPSNRIQLNIQEDMAEDKADKSGGNDANDDEPLLEEALEAILRTRQASASMLQTELRVGYSRARRLINLLEKRGYVGPAEGSKARKILYTGAVD